MNIPVRITSTMSSAMLSGPHGDGAALRLQRFDARAQAAARGDRGIEGDDHLGVAEQILLARVHAAAMGADHLVVQEAQIGEILGRQPVAMGLHRRDLAPDLVEMDGHPGAEPLLQRAQLVEQLRRAHVGRPGGDRDADTAIGLAVPLAEGLFDGGDVLLPQRAVELERRGIADRGAGPVVGALAEQEAQAGRGRALGVVVDVVGILEQEGDAAAQAFERAQLRHHAPLVGRHVGQRDRRQAAGERRLVRRREILEHAARQGHGEMGVGVGEARHHHAAAPVDPIRRGIARRQLGVRSDRGDLPALDRDRGAVVHRVGCRRR
jgi:hypothetical protein